MKFVMITINSLRVDVAPLIDIEYLPGGEIYDHRWTTKKDIDIAKLVVQVTIPKTSLDPAD